jgi:hypothetical protein
MPSKNKIIIILLFLSAAAAGFLIYIYKKQSQKELAAQQAACLEETAKMTDEQLVGKINNLSAASPVNLQLSEARRQLTSYIFCKFNASDKSEETYEQTKSLISNISFETAGRKESILKDLAVANSKNSWLFAADWSSMLAARDLTEVCPDKLPAKCAEIVLPSISKILNSTDFRKEVEWCKNLCNLISQYSEDKNKLEKEVLDFKDWDANLTIQKGQYKTRYALAYRFGGEEAAFKVCNNVPDVANREDCMSEVNTFIFNIKENRVAIEECANQRRKLESSICSVLE